VTIYKESRNTRTEMMESRLEHGRLTQQIIGAAIEVHRQPGPGFLESIYQNALVYELRSRGLSVECQIEIPIVYDRKIQVGIHRLDLLVENQIIV
jgi:GxxExxY protein